MDGVGKGGLKDWCFLGPAIGLGLYQVGGFMLPFVLVGSLSLLFGNCFNLSISGVYVDDKRDPDQVSLAQT